MRIKHIGKYKMITMRKILLGILIIICSASYFVQGQSSNLVSETTDSLYFESSALFECKVQFPESYNSEKSIPLLICLHGGGGSYETFQNIWNHFVDPHFIMGTPQAPYSWLMGEKMGYDWAAWPTGDLLIMQKALGLTSIYIENLIRSLTNKYRISEVYLMGFSQGSIITQIAGINNHDLLEGIIILSGPEIDHPGKPEIVWPLDSIVQSANQLRVLIAHGSSDKIIDIELAIKSRDQYKKMGYDVSLFEFDGGHEISEIEMKEVEKWIKHKK